MVVRVIPQTSRCCQGGVIAALEFTEKVMWLNNSANEKLINYSDELFLQSNYQFNSWALRILHMRASRSLTLSANTVFNFLQASTVVVKINRKALQRAVCLLSISKVKK